MTSRLPRQLTFEEYLRVEDRAAEKSEFIDGAIYAFPGGSVRHGVIAANVVRLLGNLLKDKPCRAVGSDLRVFAEKANLSTYPDAAVYCGSIQTWRTRDDVATNPSLIVEVLSKTTEAYDRGEKFGAYKLIPSLQDYLLIAQDKPVVELFTRSAQDVWVPSMERGLGSSITLPSLGVALPLKEIFSGVDLGTPPV